MYAQALETQFFIKNTFIDVGVEQPQQGTSRFRSKSADDKPSDEAIAEISSRRGTRRMRTLDPSLFRSAPPGPVTDSTEPAPATGVNDPPELMLTQLQGQHRSGGMHSVEEADEEVAAGATLAFANGNFAPPEDGSEAQQQRRPKRKGRRGGRSLPQEVRQNLCGEVEQAADLQELFFLVQRSSEVLTYETVVEVLRAAARKAPEGTGGHVRSHPGFQKCIHALSIELPALNAHGQDIRGIPKVLHALGKLEVGAQHAQSFLQHLRQIIPNCVHEFSTPELSNQLYGLAKLCCPRTRDMLEHLAMVFVTELRKRVSGFTPQCFANSIWSVATLQLRSPASKHFVQDCVKQLLSTPEGFTAFTTQGIANTIWGLAKIPGASTDSAVIWEVMVAARAGSAHRLTEFEAQELSMFAWAMGNLTSSSRRESRRSQSSTVQGSIEQFIVQISAVARGNLGRLSPQSLSNVAYALAKVCALADPEALLYIAEAAEHGAANIQQWQPQAISNFCYVLGQLPCVVGRGGGRQQRASRTPGMERILASAERFADAASLEALRRIQEFNWQDRSGIISALGKSGLVSHATISLIKEVVRLSIGRCQQMSTQSMLNISLNALELNIDKDLVFPMVHDIDEQFARRTPKGVKPIDLKQWDKVHKMLLQSN